MIFIPFLLINFASCSNMFEVTQCSSPSTGQPELKFRIQKTFFDLNLKHIYGTDGLSETVEDGENYYIKSVPENLLVVEFDDDSKFTSRNFIGGRPIIPAILVKVGTNMPAISVIMGTKYPCNFSFDRNHISNAFLL